MVLSKKINPLLLLILFISCDYPDRDCKDYHTGNFYTETTENNKTYKTTFSRKHNGIQIEEYEGKIDSSRVRWVNDCEMVLTPINPKKLTDKKNILIKILTTTDSSYTYEYSFLGFSQKLKAEAVRIK